MKLGFLILTTVRTACLFGCKDYFPTFKELENIASGKIKNKNHTLQPKTHSLAIGIQHDVSKQKILESFNLQNNVV